MKKYKFGDREVNGTVVEYETEREVFNTYILHDGTKLRIKAVLTSIVRLDEYKPDGDPIYLINTQNVFDTDIPPQLKKSVVEEQK